MDTLSLQNISTHSGWGVLALQDDDDDDDGDRLTHGVKIERDMQTDEKRKGKKVKE